MNTDTALTIVGWALITIGVAATVLLVVFRKRPLVRELLAMPDPTPAVQDAIDDGDDFDTHVDQALAVANDTPACPARVWCADCNAPFNAQSLADILVHVRDVNRPAAADWQAWERELAGGAS